MSLKTMLLSKIRGTQTVEELRRLGFVCGDHFQMMPGVIIDPSHCFLISCGDDVTLAPRVHILAHDASTKVALGYTRISPVSIGNEVFIGAGSIVLPGVTIGDKVIVGAGSVVTKSLEGNGVYAGSPARRICSYEEYIERNRDLMKRAPVFDASYVIDVCTDEQKHEMQAALKGGRQGYIY